MNFHNIIGHESVLALGSRFTVYILEIQIDNESWAVRHRYHDFKDLHEKLTHEGFKCPNLPPKKFIGYLNPEFIIKRQQELSLWLHQVIVDNSSDKTLKSDTLKHFLTINKQKLTAEDVKEIEGVVPKESIFHVNNTSDEGQVTSEAEPVKGVAKASLDAFELLQVIGKGSYGKVTLVRKKDNGRLYAMKSLSKPTVKRRNQVEHTLTERSVLAKAKHPYIVQLHYAFQTKQKLYFVLDYCPGGELFFHLSRMEKFPEKWCILYAAEITSALGHLHGLGIVYRDLKPENILLDSEGHVLLADFGLAKEGITEGTAGSNSMCGTPEYLPPEVLDRLGHGYCVDWWALGMVLYEMLTGLPPWYTKNRQKLFDRVRNAPLTFPQYVSAKAQSIIIGLLQREPAQRLGTKGVQEVKNHPFFDEINWDQLLKKQIKTPFNPCTSGKDDETRNFESEFTQMQLSVGESFCLGASQNLETRNSFTFQGFTYNTPSEINNALGTSQK